MGLFNFTGISTQIHEVTSSHYFSLFLILIGVGAIWFAVSYPRQFFDVLVRVGAALGTVIYKIVVGMSILLFRMFSWIFDKITKKNN